MSDKIFAEGLYARRRDDAPDWATVNLGIDVKRFVAWLEKQPVSDKGYLTVNVTRSKDGTKYSASLDTWKPSGERRQEPSESQTGFAGAMERKAASGEWGADDIPFMTHERGWLV